MPKTNTVALKMPVIMTLRILFVLTISVELFRTTAILGENPESLEKVIVAVRRAHVNEIDISMGGGLIVHPSPYMGSNELDSVKAAYGRNVQVFYDHILGILSTPKHEIESKTFAFMSTLALINYFDIRNERIISKMHEIAFSENDLPGRFIAIEYFAKMRQPAYLSHFINLLESDNVNLRLSTIRAFEHYGDDIPLQAIDALMKKIGIVHTYFPPYSPGSHEYLDKCREEAAAIATLGNLGHVASSALPVLEKLLDDDMAVDVAIAILQICPDHEKAFNWIKNNVVANEDTSVRIMCVQFLGGESCVKPFAEIESLLIQSYKSDKSKDVRLASLCSCVRLCLLRSENCTIFKDILSSDNYSKILFEGCVEYTSEEEFFEDWGNHLYDIEIVYDDNYVLQTLFEELDSIEITGCEKRIELATEMLDFAIKTFTAQNKRFDEEMMSRVLKPIFKEKEHFMTATIFVSVHGLRSCNLKIGVGEMLKKVYNMRCPCPRLLKDATIDTTENESGSE